MNKTPPPKKPRGRIRAEEGRLRGPEYFQKNKALFDKEKQMRLLRDDRSQAEALERHLASLNPAYRQAVDGRRRIKAMVDSAFRGRTDPEEVLRCSPVSLCKLCEAVGG